MLFGIKLDDYPLTNHYNIILCLGFFLLKTCR